MSRGPSRRGLLRAAVALPAVAVVSAGLGPGDQLVLRKARFIERGDQVWMVLEVPELFPAVDREALRALDSHTPTNIVFEVGIVPTYKRRTVVTTHHEVKLWLNPWTSPPRYELTRVRDGKRQKPVYFTARDEAVAAATRLEVRVASVADLGRGRSRTYYARIAALRNPVSLAGAPGSDGRSRNQDVAYFRRWISMFVSKRIRAEVALDIRTLPDFYLPEPETDAEGAADGA